MVADCTVRSTGTSHSCLAGEIPESRDPVFLRAANSEVATRARQKAGTESGAWTVALRSSPSRSGPVRAPEKKGTLTHRSQRHLNADGRTTVPTRRPSARTFRHRCGFAGVHAVLLRLTNQASWDPPVPGRLALSPALGFFTVASTACLPGPRKRRGCEQSTANKNCRLRLSDVDGTCGGRGKRLDRPAAASVGCHRC